MSVRPGRAAGSSMIEEAIAPSVKRTLSEPAAKSSSSEGKSSKLSSRASLDGSGDYGAQRRLTEIYLSSLEGEKFSVPVLIAVQLSSKLRRYIATLERASACMGQHEALAYFNRQSLEVPCSTEILQILVDFFTAKLHLDIKLSQEKSDMSVKQQQEYWRNYFYVRAWRMDLDTFADETIQVAEFLRMNSLYDLLWCCFRLRIMSTKETATRAVTPHSQMSCLHGLLVVRSRICGSSCTSSEVLSGGDIDGYFFRLQLQVTVQVGSENTISHALLPVLLVV
ncbi:hypothetical protein R1flu_006887 [Riccia fluitans]|uniref:Uncharacterized protein n=1 Tax=Riccia fluitans TaxID=41844 RepID=A0ABD1YY17_9MARC